MFGSASSVAISSTKSATGRLLDAAGGIKAIFTILSLRDQVVPATLNLEVPDPAAESLNPVSGSAWPMPLE